MSRDDKIINSDLEIAAVKTQRVANAAGLGFHTWGLNTRELRGSNLNSWLADATLCQVVCWNIKRKNNTPMHVRLQACSMSRAVKYYVNPRVVIHFHHSHFQLSWLAISVFRSSYVHCKEFIIVMHLSCSLSAVQARKTKLTLNMYVQCFSRVTMFLFLSVWRFFLLSCDKNVYNVYLNI